MTKFKSSGWIGDASSVLPRRRPPTYRGPRPQRPIPDELVGNVFLSFGLIFSPFLLLFAWEMLEALTGDRLLPGPGRLLAAWAMLVATVGGWQAASRSLRFVVLKSAVLSILLLTTIVGAAGFVVLGYRSHRSAIAHPPVRAFEYSISHGRGLVEYSYRLADGRWLGSPVKKARQDFGHRCVLVQRLDGAYGFAWQHVAERNRSPGRGQLYWGIRPSECFSQIPLSQLPR